MPVRPLPFSIDRSSTIDLTDQIVRGFVSAIGTNQLRPGARLPTIRAIAKSLGVSASVAERAVQRLAGEGLVTARRRQGIHVARSAERPWRAQVLHVHWGGESYYFAARDRRLGQRLLASNVRQVVVRHHPENPAESMRAVRLALDTFGATVVLADAREPALSAECRRRDLPLVQIARRPPGACGPAPPLRAGLPNARRQAAGMRRRSRRERRGGAAATLVIDFSQALAEMAAHCRSLAPRDIGVISPWRPQWREVSAALRAEGLACRRAEAHRGGRKPRRGEAAPLEEAERHGFDAARRLVTGGRLPELLIVPDDYVARGAVTALLCEAVRMPEDLGLVIGANRGNVPVGPTEFTRIETDPLADGEAASQAALSCIEGRPAGTVRLPRLFVVGGSTAPRRAGRGQR